MTDNRIIKTQIDDSYAVHEDMRGKTGGMISLGCRAVTKKPTQQKLNTKRQIETEVFGNTDVLP